tara:strand:+ start:2084 stop:2203 length:120 start_codon:yes stop_codon:yes gene_type:complete
VGLSSYFSGVGFTSTRVVLNFINFGEGALDDELLLDAAD